LEDNDTAVDSLTRRPDRQALPASQTRAKFTQAACVPGGQWVSGLELMVGVCMWGRRGRP